MAALLCADSVCRRQVNQIGDVLADPHLKATGLFRQREHPTEGSYVEVRPPVRFSGFDYPNLRDAPAPG